MHVYIHTYTHGDRLARRLDPAAPTHPTTPPTPQKPAPQDIEFPAQDAWASIRGGCIAAFSSDIEGMEEEQLEVGR